MQYIQVPAGLAVNLSLQVLPNALASGQSFQWEIPGIAVTGYNPYGNPPVKETPLPECKSQSVKFYWVDGEAHTVIGKARVGDEGWIPASASFYVIRPSVPLEAAANTYPAKGNLATSNGTSVVGQIKNFMVVFGGNTPQGYDNEGMTFYVTDAEPMDSAFDYTFVQVINSATVAVNTSPTTGHTLFSPINALDNAFPYGRCGPERATDSPYYPYVGPVLRATGTLWGRYDFSMYYMCRPKDGDATWIPLSVFNWKWSWTVTLVNGQLNVTSPSRSSNPQSFTDTTKFPNWAAIAYSGRIQN